MIILYSILALVDLFLGKFSEENQSHRARSIPIGANRRRGGPKKLLSGLRYQPSELVESDDEFFKILKLLLVFIL